MVVATPANVAAERLRELPRCVNSHAGFAEVVAALAQGRPATLDGVWGSSCALIAATLAEHAPSLLLVVTPELGELDTVADDLALFTALGVERFPAWETPPSEHRIRDDIYGERLRTLKHLLSAAPPRILTTSIQSLMQAVPPASELARQTRRLEIGAKFDIDDLLRWLVAQGFHNTSAVELPGEFAARGGIVDIFAPDWDQPVRMEFFDDEIESLRQFDVASQRSLERLSAIDVTVLKPDKGVKAHLREYLPPDTWVLLLEPERIATQGRQYIERTEMPEALFGPPVVLESLASLPIVTAAGLSAGTYGAQCHLQIESVQRFDGDLDHIRQEIDFLGTNHEVYIVVPTDADVQRLGEILQSTKLAARGALHYIVGIINAGFRLVQERVLVISGSELFNRGELRRTPRRHLGKAIDSFLDLREGDLVVHLSHGIGRYRGLQIITKTTLGEEQKEEHLEIEFHGGTKIFVPATKIGLVQKYIGGAKSRPQLAKIGGKLWLKQKQAAAAAVTDMASEMLELQATRQSRPGIAFASDSEWQLGFDASFPYQETPDQLTAIASIKEDMRRARPMDRLLCGDVGFGKTEVAMRAAFKAVDSGYQVAVLVPTTILCEQHYQTFRERMAEFPFDIGKLSRFCTPQEMRETVEGVKSGRIDIVVGTHRVASKDVEFSNLGLVVIDEEQRFGVEVKERLKTLRATVDVLTMSATPIPRTLHMSLVGVRDISNLETAPEDRMSVDTKVTRWNAELIRHAVLRELSRGGQIYFVHNRVSDIELIKFKLEQIVPEATIRIGHGQMPEDQLENVMVDFVNHKFDLLVATTIVESGLDIPNANTIFINEAERYGLADLHQLRGRVGRYKHKAYCYLMIDPYKHITPNAAKRLRAIEEFSEMGAGFAISMRDLEIRGAGNLLGTQQSGHIAAVGYELYCQLLENAVRDAKKMPARLTLDVDVDLPGEAYLPQSYIDDMRLKIDLYRRLARIEHEQQIAEFRAEMLDRFGALPEPVERLLALAELKIDAAVWQVAGIRIEDIYLVFDYTQRRRIEQLAKLNKGTLRVVDDESAYFTLPSRTMSPNALILLAKSVLRPG
jgi:transcription-repair coupling factor (superfamily II helicase)